MKTKEQISASVAGLRRSLQEAFGEEANFTAAVGMSIRAKLESKKLDMIDSHVSSLSPPELAMFIKAWHEAEVKRL